MYIEVCGSEKCAREKGDPKEVISYLSHVLEEELTTRFKHILETKKHDLNDVKAAREYVQAELGFVLFSHDLYASITGAGEHGSEETRGHKH